MSEYAKGWVCCFFGLEDGSRKLEVLACVGCELEKHVVEFFLDFGCVAYFLVDFVEEDVVFEEQVGG